MLTQASQWTGRIPAATISLTIIVLTVGPLAYAQQWNQWRGPQGMGVSTETNLPTSWSPNRNIKWKTLIPGRGHSSPIVWGNRVFLTTDIEGAVVPGAKAVKHTYEGKDFDHYDTAGADRQHTFKLLCLDRDTGRMLWEQTAYSGLAYDSRHRKGSYAAPTPATDGQYVYAWFGGEGDGLYCYDFTGRLIWKKSVGKIPSLGMGPGTSPVLYENIIILQCDEDNGANSFITGLDAATGRQLWRTARPQIQAGFATPLIVREGARVEIVASGYQWIVSYNPKTGRELWRTKGHQSNAIGTPVAGHGLVFVYGGLYGSVPVKKVFAVKLGATGNITGSRNIVWQYDKGVGQVPSSILYGDFLYLISDRGLLTCLDAKTGKAVYEGGRVPIPASFTASLVAFDNRILLTSEDGDTFVIKAGPRHQVLATNSVGEPVYASPAISAGMIFIRGEKHLFCIK